MQKAATLEKIAEEARVSKTTASYALSGRPGIALKTRKRIIDVAEKYNYEPNYFARALNTKRTQTIGAVFTNTLGAFMGDIVKGIEAATWQRGYQMLLSTCNNDQKREKTHIEMLLHKGVDGLMVFMVTPQMGEEFDYSHLTNLRKKKFPFVLMDRYLPGEDIDYVVTNDFAGSYEAVSHLIRLGHRRIAHVSSWDDCSSIRNRLEGYKKALTDAGIEIRPEYIATKGSSAKGAVYTATEELLQMKDRPTAISAVTGAAETFQAIKAYALRVPQDIALVGFGDSTLSAMLEVPLTVVDQPREQIGQKAAEILIEKIEHPKEAELRQISIKPKLIIRESCGANARE